MRLRQIFTAAIVALMTVMGADASADVTYNGGPVEAASSWTFIPGTTGTGLPGPGNDGFISVSGAVGNAAGTGNTYTGLDNSTITHTAGTLTGNFNYTVPGGVYNLDGGTIEATGNFNANGGSVFNLSAGSLNINGGANATDLIVNNSAGGVNVSGSAVISTDGQFDLRLNQPNAFFSIDPAWTGSFDGALENSLADWQFELVDSAAGNGGATANANGVFIDVGGTQITAANFGDFFETAPLAGGGTSLSLVAVPEPSSLAVLGLGAVCFVTRRRRS